MKLVYLDHCVISSLSSDPNRSWRDVGLGNVLGQAIDQKQARVYSSPTEVMEISLTAKFDDQGNVLDGTPEERSRLDLRLRCAKNMLDIIEAKWMAEAYEYIVLREFMDNVEKLAPGAVRTRMIFDERAENHRQVCLGWLGLLAAYRTFGAPAGILQMQRAKLTSRLLHSRFAKDPAKFVEALVDCAKNFRTTTEDIWQEYEARSVSDIRKEIEDNENATVELDQLSKTRLQKDKKLIADAYGASELTDALVAVLDNALYLHLTFDMDIIKDRWSDILGNAKAKPPSCLGPVGEPASTEPTATVDALQMLFRTFAANRLFVSSLPSNIILGELELCLASGQIPSGGLTFDSQHAAMLTRVHVFVTYDGNFANTARRAAAKINATNQWEVRVATDAGELAAALK